MHARIDLEIAFSGSSNTMGLSLESNNSDTKKERNWSSFRN
jgi:hypothetical protein